MMNEITEEEIAARELRNAAYHEAGHKVLYERFGGAGDAVVWRNDSGNPEERAWRGQFRPRICPEIARSVAVQHGLPAAELPPNWRVLVGMAGLLAEELLNADADDVDVIADNLFWKIASGEASATDQAMMNIADIDNFELNYGVVHETTRLLREKWARVQQEAEHLIELSTIESRSRHRLIVRWTCQGGAFSATDFSQPSRPWAFLSMEVDVQAPPRAAQRCRNNYGSAR